LLRRRVGGGSHPPKDKHEERGTPVCLLVESVPVFVVETIASTRLGEYFPLLYQKLPSKTLDKLVYIWYA